MRTQKQESAEQASIAAWDRIWNEAFKLIVCDGMKEKGSVVLTEEEEMLLFLIHERRLPAGANRVEGRAGGL